MEVKKTRAQILGDNLKRIRIEKNITRKQLADFLGVSVVTIGTYETGTKLAPLDKIFEIADFLQVPITDLIGVNENFQDKIFLNYRVAKAIEILKAADFEITHNADDSFVVSFEMNFVKDIIDAFNFTVAPKKIELKFANATEFLKVSEKAEKLQIGIYNTHRLRELFYRISKGANDEELENIVMLKLKD